jgi:hypothetical protein
VCDDERTKNVIKAETSQGIDKLANTYGSWRQAQRLSYRDSHRRGNLSNKQLAARCCMWHICG